MNSQQLLWEKQVKKSCDVEGDLMGKMREVTKRILKAGE